MAPESSLTARACVLAGGAGSRLGRPKATALLAGRPLISYPLAALEAAGLRPVVVAKPDTELPPLDREPWLEGAGPRHPLVGILEALDRAGGTVLACACDMPFVTAELAGWLASLRAPLVVPRAGGRAHPLLARYAPDLTDSLAAALAGERPLAAAVEAIGPRYVGEHELRRFGDPERLLANVNTPDDLARAERLLAAG
jgi:molybdopterin-guanine dinucleotide biosynthesis protein A